MDARSHCANSGGDHNLIKIGWALGTKIQYTPWARGLLKLSDPSCFKKRCFYNVFGHFLFGFPQRLLSCLCCCLPGLSALSPPILLENNGLRQLFCHEILNINMSQRQTHSTNLGWGIRRGQRICQKEKLRLEIQHFCFIISQHHWPTVGHAVGIAFWVHVCSPSHLQVHKGQFLKKTYFEIISDLQRSCKDGLKSSHISFTQHSRC